MMENNLIMNEIVGESGEEGEGCMTMAIVFALAIPVSLAILALVF